MPERPEDRGVFSLEWIDLLLTAFSCLLTVVVVFAPVVRETPLRVVVGLGFVLFVPGYAFIAALFPERSDRQSVEESRSVDELERVVLSFGSSIALVPLVGLVLNFTPWGIRLLPVVVGLVGLTLALCGAAVARRRALPREQRFHLPWTSFSTVRDELLHPTDRTDAALNILLVLSLLVAVSSVSFAVAVPTQSEPFTEFYLLTENESGTLVADNYPQNFTAGEPKPIVVGISNHEHQSMNYSVVVELQRVNTSGGEVRVVEERRIDDFYVELAPGETWRQQRTIRPEMTGERLRLQYLLYRGDSPVNATAETAYRQVNLWISVHAS